MSTRVVFETHSISEDNETGRATGWLPGQRILVIGHVATRLAFDHYLNGIPLAESLTADSARQAGWEYVAGRDG